MTFADTQGMAPSGLVLVQWLARLEGDPSKLSSMLNAIQKGRAAPSTTGQRQEIPSGHFTGSRKGQTWWPKNPYANQLDWIQNGLQEYIESVCGKSWLLPCALNGTWWKAMQQLHSALFQTDHSDIPKVHAIQVAAYHGVQCQTQAKIREFRKYHGFIRCEHKKSWFHQVWTQKTTFLWEAPKNTCWNYVIFT